MNWVSVGFLQDSSLLTVSAISRGAMCPSYTELQMLWTTVFWSNISRYLTVQFSAIKNSKIKGEKLIAYRVFGALIYGGHLATRAKRSLDLNRGLDIFSPNRKIKPRVIYLPIWITVLKFNKCKYISNIYWSSIKVCTYPPASF